MTARAKPVRLAGAERRSMVEAFASRMHRAFKPRTAYARLSPQDKKYYETVADALITGVEMDYGLYDMVVEEQPEQ